MLELRRRASLSALEVTRKEHEQVRDTLDLQIGSWSAEDMKDFQALDIANCRIIRGKTLKTLPIQAEVLAPTYERQQTLFLQDYRENLYPLHLEISSACLSASKSVIAYSQTTALLVTIREDFSFPGIIFHNYDHLLRSEEQEAIQENFPSVLQVVMDHCSDMEHLKQIEEETLLREEMHRHIQFFADDEHGIGLFLPDYSDSDDYDNNDQVCVV